MKRITLIFCLLFFSMTVSGADNIRFWEQYSETEKSSFLKSVAMETHLLSVYNDSFAISDNEETFELLDLLSNNKYGHSQTNAIVDAFYFHCFSKILILADGALAEVMGYYCMRIVKNSPQYTILYLMSHKEIRDAFVTYIGYEIYCSDDQNSIYEDLMNCLKVDTTFAEEFVAKIKNWVLQVGS